MKTGLWKAVSQKGLNYYKGTIEINGVKHSVAVFKNENKMNEKSPDLTLTINESKTITPNSFEVEKMPDKVFADFGTTIELSEDEIAF